MRICLRRVSVKSQTIGDAYCQTQNIPTFISTVGTLQISGADEKSLDVLKSPVAQQIGLHQSHGDVIMSSGSLRIVFGTDQPMRGTNRKYHVQQNKAGSVRRPLPQGTTEGRIEERPDTGYVKYR